MGFVKNLSKYLIKSKECYFFGDWFHSIFSINDKTMKTYYIGYLCLTLLRKANMHI